MLKKLLTSINKQGFTLIEVVMVILLLSILAAVGITSFQNFQRDAKEAAVKANLQIMRNGIAAQYGNLQLHCNDVTDIWPLLANINANDITNGGAVAGSCSGAMVTAGSDRQFAANGIPVNPWGLAKLNTVSDCTAHGGVGGNPGPATGSCLPTALVDCITGAGYGALGTGDGWCYDPTTGKFWANSINNPTINEVEY